MSTIVNYVADMTCSTAVEYNATLAYLATMPPGRITSQSANPIKRTIHVEWTDPDWKPL